MSSELSNLTQVSSEYNTIILGGGIHGVGVLHDLTSRGFKNCLLVEITQKISLEKNIILGTKTR